MKVITRTITLCTAAELKADHPAAFAAALERYNDGQDDYGHDAVTEDFLCIARLMGFNTDAKQISWSGFGSQGDGASFTGSAAFAADALEKVKDYAPQDQELHRIAAECAEYGKQGIRCKLERNSHHYSHANTVSVDAYRLDVLKAELPDVQQTCRDLMQWLYRQLEKDYEYRCSEECFLENAKSNEWTFTADGKMDNDTAKF